MKMWLSLLKYAVPLAVAVALAVWRHTEEKCNAHTNENSRKRRKCVICNEIVLVSMECKSIKCGCLMHDCCINSLIKEGQLLCPACKMELGGIVKFTLK